MKIGFVTIGQSPRDDLINVFRNRLDARHELLLTGALDGLTPDQVSNLAPASHEEPLVTQLETGQPVRIAKERIVQSMQLRIDELQALGVDMIVVLCTGPFPELTAAVPLLLPDEVLRHFVIGVMPKGGLGVIAPLAGQYPMMERKWHPYAPLTLGVIDPYGDHQALDGLQAFDTTGLVVLDCMGYSPRIQGMVRDHVGKPVVLAQEVLAHAVQLLAGD